MLRPDQFGGIAFAPIMADPAHQHDRAALIGRVSAGDRGVTYFG